jgi:hypothetical protein
MADPSIAKPELRDNAANALDEIGATLSVGALAGRLGNCDPVMFTGPVDGKLKILWPPILATLIDESNQLRCRFLGPLGRLKDSCHRNIPS